MKRRRVPANFNIRKGLNKSFIHDENSTRTILVSENQILRLDADILKTEPPVKEIISQTEAKLQDTEVGPSHQDKASVAASAAEHQQPKP